MHEVQSKGIYSNTRAGSMVIVAMLHALKPVAPLAYQVILEPGIGQFREVESPRVHSRINS